MCDRLAVPERTRHPAPAHDQAAAQGAGLEVHGGLGRHRGAIVAARGYRTGVGGFVAGRENYRGCSAVLESYGVAGFGQKRTFKCLEARCALPIRKPQTLDILLWRCAE